MSYCVLCVCLCIHIDVQHFAVAHLFSFLYCLGFFLFVFVLCRMFLLLPISLDCPFLIFMVSLTFIYPIIIK